MNRGCKVESYSDKYLPNTSLTKTRQPLCLDDNNKDRMPTMDHGKYSLFSSGAPNEDIIQNHLNIALLNVF